MDSSNCLSYKRLVILHKLRCANCVTKILYFFHTTKLSVPDFSNFIFFTRIFFLVPNYRIFVFTRNIADSHGFSFLLFLSRIIELSNFCLHTEYRGRSRIFFFSSCHELSNYRILSFLSRDCPLSRDLSLDPLTAGR